MKNFHKINNNKIAKKTLNFTSKKLNLATTNKTKKSNKNSSNKKAELEDGDIPVLLIKINSKELALK